MEVNYELEEGEAYYYKEDDDHIDPDIDLSYIDEKIQNVLGHFQKEFEGVVTAENLGAKFGGYGSFLPMYERTPSTSAKTPQRICRAEKSPSCPPEERAFHNVQIPSAVPSFERPETGSHNARAVDDESAKSSGIRMKYDSAPLSPPTIHKADLKNETSSKPNTLTNHRPLTVRIKVNSDNSAIYSGLGLDNSPSSSFEDCPNVGKGMSPAAREFADKSESPTRIIEVMTSFPVPGGHFISPLPSSMLCLKPLPTISMEGEQKPLLGHQTQASSPVNECVSGLDSEPSNEVVVANPQGRREMMVANLSGLGNVQVHAVDVSKKSKSMTSEKTMLANQQGSGPCESQKVNTCSKPCSKKKTPHQVALGGQEELCPGREKPLPERKKNSIGSSKEAVNLLPRDSLKVMVNASSNIVGANSDDSKSRGKIDVAKSQRVGAHTPLKDATTANGANRSRDQPPNSKSVSTSGQMGSFEMPPGGKSSVRQNASSSTLEKRCSGHAVDHQPLHVAAPSKNAASEMLLPPGPPVLIEENWVCCDSCQKWRLLPFGTKPEHLPEKWLCRMLTWLPGMNRCDISEEATTKALNALYHVPMTASSVQHNQQSLSNGGSKVANPAHHQHPDLNGQSLDSSESAKKKHHFKKIEKLAGHNNGVVQATASAKNHVQESMKSRSLDGVSQFDAESNLVNTSSSKDHLSKPTNLAAENPRSNARGNSSNGGSENEPAKSKNKREPDQFLDRENSKKSKIDEHGGDNYQKPSSDLSRAPVNPRNGSSSASEKCGKKSSQSLDARNTKNGRMENRLLISLKKPGEQAQIVSRPTCLVMEDKNEASARQRRPGEGLDRRNSPHHNLAENSGSMLEMEKKADAPGRVANEISSEKGSNCGEKSRDHSGGRVEQCRSICQDKQTMNCRNIASHQNLDGTDCSRKEIIRCRRLSGATSPVGSASSSPSGNAPREKSTCSVRQNLSLRDDPVKDRDYSSDSDPNKYFPLDDGNRVGGNAKPTSLSNGGVETVEHHGGGGSMNCRNAKSAVHGKCVDQSEVKKEGARSGNGSRFRVEEADLTGKPGSSTAGNCKLRHSSEDDKMDETRADVMQVGSRFENPNLIARPNKKEKNERQNHSRRDDSPPPGAGRRHEGYGSRGNLRSVALHASSLRATNFRLTVTNTLKEAEDLRSTAVRLKDAGFVGESGEAYFQSALKFLYGASLIEPCHAEEEMMQIQVYHTAAKLGELCALEYEARQEMTVASLAYKCMEVACWRIVCCKNSSCSRDRSELETIMQTVPPGSASGESPSSSSSDVDNLNNQAASDRAMVAKVTVSQATRTPATVAHNHPNFLRLLDFTQDVNSAMEASKKSMTAFSSAGVMNSKSAEVLTSVKKAIDFSFQDVEAFIRLVQHAMDAITRHDFFSSRN